MGPKKTVAKRRLAAGQSSTERRTKQREDPHVPPAPAAPIPPRIQMANRTVVTGRKVSFTFLEQEHFLFGQWIKNQGWERFCTLDVPVYPNLVKEFFENLRLGTSQIHSTVKGKEVIIDEPRLCRLLDMPNQGLCYLVLTKKVEGLRVILERRDAKVVGNLQANQLSVGMRLLHNMVGRLFFPKTGRFDWVTERDIAFIYFLSKGQSMNLPFLMMTQIKEAARKARFCLPYGMVFTLLFQDFEIDCTGEVARRLLHTDHYSDRTLHRMGLQKVDDRWVRRISGQRAAESDSDDVPAADDDDDEGDDDEESRPQPADDEIPDSTVPGFPEDTGPSTAHVDSPRTPPAATTTVPPAATARVSTEDLSQLRQSVVTDVRSMMETLLGDHRREMSQLTRTVTDSYQELRGDLRELTLRVEVLERADRSQGTSTEDYTELRSDFGRMQRQIEGFAREQSQSMVHIQMGVARLETELGAVLAGFTGARSSFGASSSQAPRPPPPPQATPRHSPRPPFFSTVRPGTGFPPPPSIGPASRTRANRYPGPPPRRSSRVMAPFTVDLHGDSDSSSE